MSSNVIQTAEWIAKVGGAILVISGVLAAVFKGIKWVGTSIGTFVDEKVLPPINKLTLSVDELAARTHENTASLAGFAKEQSDINHRTAKEIAHIRGHLNL